MDTEVILKNEYALLKDHFKKLMNYVGEVHAFTSTIQWGEDEYSVFEGIKDVAQRITNARVMLDNYKANNAYAYIGSKYMYYIIKELKIRGIPVLLEEIHFRFFELDECDPKDLEYIVTTFEKASQQIEYILNLIGDVMKKLSSLGTTDEGILLPNQAEILFNTKNLGID